MEKSLYDTPWWDRLLRRHDLVYHRAMRELKAGRKETRWIRVIFPSLRGLARNRHVYFSSLPNGQMARAFLEHPILGKRLAKACRALLAHQGTAILTIFSNEDAEKLRASMTLFASISPEDSVFHQVLEHFFDGNTDPVTEGLLSGKIIDFTPRRFCLAHS